MRKLAIPIGWALAMTAARLLDPLLTILIAATTMMAIVLWRERAIMRALFRITPRMLVLGAGAAVAMVGVTYLATPLLIRWIPSIGGRAHEIYLRFLTDRTALGILAAVLPVIVAEEVLWRGAFQQGMGRWGVIITAAVYAIAHAPLGSLLLVVVAFICGLYWSALRALSGSLIPSLCAHLAWDIGLIVFPLVLVR